MGLGTVQVADRGEHGTVELHNGALLGQLDVQGEEWGAGMSGDSLTFLEGIFFLVLNCNLLGDLLFLPVLN